MIQAMIAVVLLASVYAVWATGRDLRADSQNSSDGRISNLGRIGLLAAGVVVASGAYAAGDHLVWPALEAVIGPPVITDHATPSLFGQEIISTLVGLSLFAFWAGAVVGRRKHSHPMDGHWFVNPISSILGLVVYSQVAVNFFGYEPTFFYWGVTMRFVQVFCLPALCARAYYAGATMTTKPDGAAQHRVEVDGTEPSFKP